MGVVTVKFSGRFGNQLHQYAVARAYAEKIGAEFRVGPWAGQTIFELADLPLAGKQYPRAKFDEIPNGRSDITLDGYFQTQDAINTLSRKKLRQWFKLRNKWNSYLTHPYATAHIRRGDYTKRTNTYALVTIDSYFAAFKKFGVDTEVEWVYDGAAASPPGLERLGVGFLPDFLAMMSSKHLFRSNSTFSWWAATLSDATVYSPIITRAGELHAEFVKGNWPRLVFDPKFRVTDLHLPD